MSGLPSNYPGEIPRPLYLGNNTSSHESSSAPSTLSPSTPSSVLPGVAMLAGPQLLSRQDIASGRLPYPPPHSIHIPPINDIQPRYIPEYDPTTHQEQIRMRGVMNVAPNISAIGPLLTGQKRAYRQRRKDPSCDACRERKVKVKIKARPLRRVDEQDVLMMSDGFSAMQPKPVVVLSVLVEASSASLRKRQIEGCRR